MWFVIWKDQYDEKYIGTGDSVDSAWENLNEICTPIASYCTWYWGKPVAVTVETTVNFSVPLGY